MRFAYLIAAHDKGDQLFALINHLLAPATQDYIVLHLDRKSALWREEHQRFASHPSGRLHLVPDPVDVHWGHQSQLAATLKMLSVANAKGFDMAHHISGSDWPVTSRPQVEAEIAANPKAAHIEIIGPVQQERMQSWWFDRTTLPVPARFAYRTSRFQSQFSRAFTRFANQIGIERSQSDGEPWLKGWSWWSLPHDIACTIEHQIGGLLQSGRLRFTQCCDEHVIPTLVARAFPERVAPYRRYIKWPADSYHPLILTAADASAIAASGAWFARKFDADVDGFFLSDFGGNA
jgi:hypothetical protein